MEYRVAQNRLAVNFDFLRLPISNQEALNILYHKGFKIIKVDIIEFARQCVGVSRYCRGAKFSEAPAIVDCSIFTKWLYAQRGIWLPRLAIQQREFGEKVSLNEFMAGDLVFVSGYFDYYYDDSTDGVGHVSIVTGDETVIHATHSGFGHGVVETSLQSLFCQREFRGARRYVSKNTEVFTLEIPVNQEIKTTNDIRWIILQSL